MFPTLAFGAMGPSDFLSVNSFQNMRPFMNNSMRTQLNPGVPASAGVPENSVFVRQESMGNRVVARNATNAAASAVGSNSVRAANTPAAIMGGARRVVARPGGNSGLARLATNVSNASFAPMNSLANNVALPAVPDLRRVVPRSARGAGLSTTQIYTADVAPVSQARCFADYVQCMNGYCEHPKTPYNRCFCSSKLAQIDAKYQPAIDQAIRKILEMQGGGTYTQEEMREYWEQTIGQYTGENSWLKLDNALNIDWASMGNKNRGEEAFVTGHDFCVRHLSNCYSLGTNLRDAYKSEISRDCATYEKGLESILSTAQSIIN